MVSVPLTPLTPTTFMKAMRDFVIYRVDKDRLVDWLWSQYAHRSVANDLALCTECGQCEEACPQHLKIIPEIQKAIAALDAAGQPDPRAKSD